MRLHVSEGRLPQEVSWIPSRASSVTLPSTYPRSQTLPPRSSERGIQMARHYPQISLVDLTLQKIKEGAWMKVMKQRDGGLHGYANPDYTLFTPVVDPDTAGL